MSSERMIGRPRKHGRPPDQGWRERGRAVAVAEAGCNDVADHDQGDLLGEHGEDIEMAAEIGLREIQQRELDVGVDRDSPRPGKVFETAAHTPGRQTLIEDPRENCDPFGIGGETTALLRHEGVRTVEIDHRGEIEVDAETAARGAGRFAEGAHGLSTRRCGLGGAREFTPDGAEPVDHAAFEIDRDKGPGIEFDELAKRARGPGPADSTLRWKRITPAGWMSSRTRISSALRSGPGTPTTRGMHSIIVFGLLLQLGEDIEGFDGGERVDLDLAQLVDELIGRWSEELELVGAFGGAVGRRGDHRVARDVDFVALEIAEDLLGAAADLLWDTGEFGDVNPIRSIGRVRRSPGGGRGSSRATP